MLRKFLDFQLSIAEKFPVIKPLITALDTFCYEAPCNTRGAPHIRDAVDLKRWMSIVIVALLPTIFMAMWNTGLQAFVFQSGDWQLMEEYFSSIRSLDGYWNFAMKDGRWLSFLKIGASAFLPIMFVSYAVGGLVEGIFACVRKHEIAEGFLVTGMLYPLILPPTIPLWMVAVGVAVGIVLCKELFGGTGMNIMNPALACRAFLFFGYPAYMSGDVWVGTSSSAVRESLVKMNSETGKSGVDAYTQATSLAKFNIPPEVKQVHVNTIATNDLGNKVDGFSTIQTYFDKWSDGTAKLGELTSKQMQEFVTSPITEGGLGLSSGYYEDASAFSSLKYGLGSMDGDWLWFFGNKLGCMGETSFLAALIGAFIIIFTAVGSWRTMLSLCLGAFITASLFQWGSLLAAEGGAWLPAQLGFPAYKHLLVGGLAFGLVYMATDPVSSADTKLGQWVYGALIGIVAIVIRVINPAYPEGVMLAIILGNCFHPLIDYYVLKKMRRRQRVPT